MRKGIFQCCILLFLSGAMVAQQLTEPAMPISKKDKAIIAIAAFTAQGDMPRLKTALHEGLDARLSINEIKEMLVQLYAYTGFPRSLNGLHNLMAVLEERRTKGIHDSLGKEPTPLDLKGTLLEKGTANQTALVGSTIAGGVYDFAPVIDRFLKEHLFGAIFSRDNLDWKTREWVTISALAVLDGAEAQLRSHFGVGMHNGLTTVQLQGLVDYIGKEVDRQRGAVAAEVLYAVLAKEAFAFNQFSRNTLFPSGDQIRNENFTGTAWLNQLILADSSSTIQVGNVTFEPGARTKWHYHPAGQILIILEGLGYYQELGEEKRLLRKGDVVKCPPNRPHWHGAAPDVKLVQLAITDTKNGVTVWQQAVTDREYTATLEK